jgi:hypothetical protein
MPPLCAALCLCVFQLLKRVVRYDDFLYCYPMAKPNIRL